MVGTIKQTLMIMAENADLRRLTPATPNQIKMIVHLMLEKNVSVRPFKAPFYLTKERASEIIDVLNMSNKGY